jgi:hypothetical protein
VRKDVKRMAVVQEMSALSERFGWLKLLDRNCS